MRKYGNKRKQKYVRKYVIRIWEKYKNKTIIEMKHNKQNLLREERVRERGEEELCWTGRKEGRTICRCRSSSSVCGGDQPEAASTIRTWGRSRVWRERGSGRFRREGVVYRARDLFYVVWCGDLPTSSAGKIYRGLVAIGKSCEPWWFT